MIEIIKELDVEVTKPNIFQAIVAKQYDMNTRFLKVTLKDSGTRIDVPNIETAKVVINAERKDGQSKGFDGVINEDGTVTVPLHSWMLELEGTVICDISVMDTATDDNKKLTTTSFTLIVEKAAYGGDDITSDPQYDVLVQLLETCAEAGTMAEEALAKSNEANAKYDACVEAANNANQAADNANSVREEIEAGGYIESLKETNKGLKFTTWIGTQAEYDAIETKENGCFYIISDDAEYENIMQAINYLNDKMLLINQRAETNSGDISNIRYGFYNLSDKVEIPENANFNNYTTAGVYVVRTNSGSETIDNIPVFKAGILIVNETLKIEGKDYTDKYILQTFIEFSGQEYKRYCDPYSGYTWNEWQQVITTGIMNQQLYSGYLYSGENTATIPNLDKYTLLKVRLAGTGYVFCAVEKMAGVYKIKGVANGTVTAENVVSQGNVYLEVENSKVINYSREITFTSSTWNITNREIDEIVGII